MKRCLAAVAFIFLLASFSYANSWTEDDSRFVSLGPRNGYYIVRPDSPLFHKLRLFEAPWIDTASTFSRGYGADALAFRFNRNGVLITPAAYIAQASVSDFYTRRIGSLVRGRSTARDVEAMFGHGHGVASRPDGFIYYYALPVYNPAEDWGGRR
jgi:hypothetical protein